MKAELPPLRIGKPCPREWDAMSGNATRRFCGECQLHVHNLSEMSRRERERFVAGAAGGGCIAYVLRPDGTMVTRSRLASWRRVIRPLVSVRFAVVAVLAAWLPFLFAGCATNRRSLGKIEPSSQAQADGKGGGIETVEGQYTVGVVVPDNMTECRQPPSHPGKGTGP